MVTARCLGRVADPDLHWMRTGTVLSELVDPDLHSEMGSGSRCTTLTKVFSEKSFKIFRKYIFFFIIIGDLDLRVIPIS